MLYNAVLVSTAMHRLQHITFFVTALMFWWALVNPRMRQAGHVAVICLFFTVLHSSFLGILLTMSKHLWYDRQTVLSEAWCLTPLGDQQLAGLVV